MRKLNSGYTVEIDKIDKNNWHDLLLEFDDATFYQTWSFGVVHCGENKLSHLVLKKNGTIVSIVQLRIIKIPLLRTGIAYINWGPLFKRTGEKVNILHLRNMIRALYREYVIHRGYMLRILPKIVDEEEKDVICNIYKEENYSWNPDPQKTIVVNLSPSFEELRKDLPRGVRHSLNFAEKQNMEFIEGSDDELLTIALKIVQEMKLRKKYVIFSEPDELLYINKDLPETLKLKIIICKYENEPVAAIGWQTIGKIGIPLVAATGDKALKLKASVLIWWEMIKYFKEHGFSKCDFAGVHPKRNPGGYFFKKSLAGRKYKEIEHYIGQFDACENYLFSVSFKMCNSLRIFYRKSIINLNKAMKYLQYIYKNKNC